MIFFSIGMPSRLTEWCDAVITRLAISCFGAVENTALNTLEELASALLKTRATHLVACSRQPVVRLQTEIVQGKRPFLVAVGDPRDALRNLAERDSYDVAGATRAVASSCATVLSLTRAPAALVVSGGNADNAPDVAAAIADHFQMPIGQREIGKIISELREVGVTLDNDKGEAWCDGLGERDQAIINGALLPYLSYLEPGVHLDPLVWEPELFFVSKDPPADELTPASEPVDITGRPRYLIYGPFINLPPGSWRANVVVGLSAEAADMSFMVEVFAGRRLSHAQLEPSGAQITEVNLEFIIDDSVDQPLQIRIVNERAAFDGRLALGYVTMASQTAIPSQTRDRLAAVLRK